MTDKQIIIDEEGKECAFYANGKCTCSDFCLASYCADAPLCIYKQWLRKEQECEELKAKFELFKTSNQTTIDQLKAENEELKERFSYFHHPDVEFEQERNAFINEIKKNNKLKQTLAEIKKLVEKEFCRHPECCEFCAISNDCINQKIIEKINEVEDDNIRNI